MDIQRQAVLEFTKNFVREQSCGEWDDKTINEDAEKLTDEILMRLPVWSAMQGLKV